MRKTTPRQKIKAAKKNVEKSPVISKQQSPMNVMQTPIIEEVTNEQET